MVAKRKATHTTFLDLPGEIRNQIYAYYTYPELDPITISNCTKPEHFGEAVLRPPLFRVSRQVRAEALSYLCANHTFKFFSLQAAVLFFSYMGIASSEIKSLVLMQLVLEEGSQEMVDKFFSALEKMSALSEVNLDQFAHTTGLHQRDQCVDFIGRLDKLRAREVVVHIKLDPRRWH